MKQKEKAKIMIAVPNLGNIATNLAFNWLQWITDKRFQVSIIAPQNVRPIPAARNLIAKTFLDSECEYLLMIDADMSSNPNLLDLATFDKDVIGALCFINKDEGIIPTVHERYGHGYKVMDSVSVNTLTEVDATGTGCLMIHRRVFEAMEPPYFEYLLTEEGLLKLGQDYYFCMKAKQAGFRIWVHTKYIAAHYQTVELFATYKRYTNLIKQATDVWAGVEMIQDGDSFK